MHLIGWEQICQWKSLTKCLMKCPPGGKIIVCLPAPFWVSYSKFQRNFEHHWQIYFVAWFLIDFCKCQQARNLISEFITPVVKLNFCPEKLSFNRLIYEIILSLIWYFNGFVVISVDILSSTIRAPVFGRHQFFGTSEHYGKAHGSFIWMKEL